MRRTRHTWAATLAVIGIVVAALTGATPATAATTPAVDRWGEADRYLTSTVISSRTFAPGVRAAFVAAGSDFPDALSGAASAVSLGGPLLLTYQYAVPAPIEDELRRLKPQKIYVLGGEVAVSDAVVETLNGLAPGGAQRLAGEDRYGTSAAISQAVFPAGSGTVFLASGASFPDALSASPAAGGQSAPLLLTDPWTLSPAAEAELRRLLPRRVVIAGGPSAVSDAVANRVSAVTGVAVQRIFGDDRYATSAAMTATFAPGVGTVLVASGTSFPDALSGAAAARGGPLLLTPPDALALPTARELKRLRPSRVVILGGTSAVSAVVADRTAVVAADLAPATGASITRTTEVKAGSCLPSADSAYRLCVDAATGVSVFRGSTLLWSAGAADSVPLGLRIRSDGLAVLYTEDGRAIWDSSTAGTSATELVMQNDGDAMLRTSTGGVVWSSLTSPASPVFQLPFAKGASWSAGAPHANTGGTAGARGAIDFGPRSGGDRRVFSIAAGTVYSVQCSGGSYLGINHANGWQSTYYHLVNYQQQLVGQYVPAGTYLGDVGRTVPCGGSATFDHVHLVLRRGGNPVSVQNVTFGGYTVHSSGQDYWGYWTDATGARVLTASGGAMCCLAAR